jgi:hypothetical protein
MAMAVPRQDAKLAEYSANFNTRGTEVPGDFGLSAAQMTQYSTLHSAWMSAYNACKADGAKSKALVVAKDDAKWALIPYARQLYKVVKYAAGVSNENKTLIGIHLDDREPTEKRPPIFAPVVSILSVIGRTTRCSIADATAPSSRRRPANASGATILSYVGTTPPPADDPNWKLEGQTGRTRFLVQFPASVQPGTPCWVTALWYNARGEYSPACAPVQTYLAIGPVTEVA